MHPERNVPGLAHALFQHREHDFAKGDNMLDRGTLTRLDRPTLRRLRAILHRAKTEGTEAQNRDHHPDFKGYLQGMIAYAEMANPQQAKPLKQASAQLAR